MDDVNIVDESWTWTFDVDGLVDEDGDVFEPEMDDPTIWARVDSDRRNCAGIAVAIRRVDDCTAEVEEIAWKVGGTLSYHDVGRSDVDEEQSFVEIAERYLDNAGTMVQNVLESEGEESR